MLDRVGWVSPSALDVYVREEDGRETSETVWTRGNSRSAYRPARP